MRTRWMAMGMACWFAAAPTLGAYSSSLALDHLAHQYTDPKAIASFLRHEFTFTRDEDLFGEADRWQSPEEFLTRKAGDCEDYALLAKALLERNWITAYVFSLFGDDNYAHTVCVFLDEHGRYNVINQDQVRYYRAKSLEALASALHPGWTFGGIVEQDGLRGRFVKRITNVHPAPALGDDAFATGGF